MTGAQAWPSLSFLLEGFRLTIWLTFLCAACSLPLGAVVGIARSTPVLALRAAGTAYVEFFRNVPPLILLFFFYFGLPGVGVTVEGFTCGVIALTLYTAAFVAESVRAGIAAVDRGQVEAARSLGFGYLGALRYVVFPQAVAMVLPALGNITIGIVKNTALVATIGVADLMHQGEVLESRTFATFSTFTTVALFYLALIIPMSLGVNALDRRRRRMA
ncbi:MAG TPA: amino acid ABC transporter permease [Usitatibacter sp.]|nr:amino acid ABC transporter permease [Usitatibacter sp.]